MPLHPRFLWIVPLFHCNGWCFPWTMAAAAGTSYFLRQIRAESMFYIIQKYQVQYFAGAPVTMNTMLAHKEKFKFSHRVQMWAAGAPPPTSVIKRFNDEIGVEVQCAYGLTETYGPICTHNADRDWLIEPTSASSSSSSGGGGGVGGVKTQRPLSAHELLLKSTYLSCDTTVEDLKVCVPPHLLRCSALLCSLATAIF
jgi:fatty-acyl-CoA synthase